MHIGIGIGMHLSPNFAGAQAPTNLAPALATWTNDSGERSLTGNSVFGYDIWRARSEDGVIYHGPFQTSISEISTGRDYEVKALAKEDLVSNMGLYFAGTNFNTFATLTSSWQWYSQIITAGAGQTVEIRASDFILIAAMEIREV